MDLDLKVVSNTILVNLDKFNNKTDIERINTISKIIKNTPLSLHTPVYKLIVSFYEKQGRVPTYGHLEDLYKPILDKSKIHNVSSIFDYVDTFIAELNDLSLQSHLLDTISKKDFKETSKLLETEQVDKSSLHEININDVISSYNELKALPKGLLSGVKVIDQYLKGFSYGTLNLIGAPSSCFKTTYAISILYNSCIKANYNMVFLNLEGMVRDVWYNLISRHSYEMQKSGLLKKAVEAERIKKGILNVKEYRSFEATVEQWEKDCKGKVFVVAPADMGGFSTQSFSSYLRSKSEEVELDGVIVDYLQLLKFYKIKGVQEERELLNYYVRYFHNLSINFQTKGLIIILLAQVNREHQKILEKKRQASLFSFADTSELERSAHSAIILYADDKMKISKEVGMQIVKNRSGKIMDELSIQLVEPHYYAVGVDEPDDVYSLDIFGSDIDNSSNNDIDDVFV